MQPVENIKPGEFLADMEEIYHLDSKSCWLLVLLHFNQ